MSVSSIQAVDTQRADLRSALSDLLGESVVSLEAIGGGRNSRVYQLKTVESTYVAKCYFQHHADDRDRLGVEFSSLQFLWSHGVRAIPRPITMNRRVGCAVYEYIQGEQIQSDQVTSHDIDTTVAFLAALKALRSQPGSRTLPEASEACFSVQAILDSIERRVSRLRDVELDANPQAALRAFLDDAFIPAVEVISQWCVREFARSGLSVTTALDDHEKTLSPSDVGFHNTLRRPDGQLVFLDFEYFGWDDSAKMIADFLLHPAMSLSGDLKQRFFTRILEAFPEHTHLAERVEVVYPLFGLKWCVILLNEFVPQDQLRRGFTQPTQRAVAEVQAEQLAKATRMLSNVLEEYEHFPYRR